MRMALSASTQRPQKVHLARSRRATRWLAVSSELIAPVGQTAAAGRASVQLGQSISGLPRAWAETSGAAAGERVVATPTFKLLRRTANMGLVIANSAVSARIREVETFVYDGKIGNNVSENRLGYRGPILQRRLFALAAGEPVSCRRANPMKNLPTPAFDVPQCGPIRRYCFQ